MKRFHPPCPSDNSLWRTVNSAKKLLLSSRSEMLNLSIILLLSHHVTNIHLPNNTMMTDQNDLPTQWTADYWELQHEEHLKKGKIVVDEITKEWGVKSGSQKISRKMAKYKLTVNFKPDFLGNWTVPKAIISLADVVPGMVPAIQKMRQWSLSKYYSMY